MALLDDNTRLKKEDGNGISLTQIAKCLRDYRVNTKGQRDLGLLKTSPKVKLQSVRRPIDAPFTKDEDTETYMQSQAYGYSGVELNSKFSTGGTSAVDFMDNAITKGQSTSKYNFWEPKSLTPTTQAGIKFFDGYYNVAKWWGEGDVLHPLIKKSIERGNTLLGNVSLTADADGVNSSTIETGLNCERSLIMSGIKLVFTSEDISSATSAGIVFKVSGYLPVLINNQEVVTRYFNLNTEGQTEGVEWEDSVGNVYLLERLEEDNFRPKVSVILNSISHMYGVGNAEEYLLSYKIQDYSNDSTSTEDGATSNIAVNVGMYVDSLYNAVKASYYEDEFVGFYYENNNSYDTVEWNRSVDDLPTPYEFFFTDRGVSNHNPLILLRLTSENTADEEIIVNPFHDYGETSFGGYILYDFLKNDTKGFSETALSNPTKMELIKVYGDSSFLDSEEGFTTLANINDKKFVIAPFAYNLIQEYNIEV